MIANPDSPCAELGLNRWDGEGYGNPRTHGAFTDIGFDEVGLYVMAGSYANGDASHNRTTLLNPSVGASQPERRVLVPVGANGQTFAGQATLRIKGAERAIPGTIPPWVPPAWTRPPYTLAVPLVNPSLPVGYQTAWINMSVERWSAPLLTSNLFTWGTIAVPLWTSKPILHLIALPPDDEGPAYYSWFNTQVEVDFGNPNYSDLWSNLQAEYR